MPPRRNLRSRDKPLTNITREFTSTRPRRAASGASVTVDRDLEDDEDSPEEAKKALKLNFKMPSSKLREATSASSIGDREGLQDSLTRREAVSGPRSTRNNKKSYVLESESDEIDEEEPSEADVGDDEDEDLAESPEKEFASEDENEDPNEDGDADPDADEDAEEEVDADGDIDMDEDADDGLPLGPAPPKLKVNGPAAKPTVTVTPAQDTKLKSVEAKEMEMTEDDEELSELQSDDDDELDAGAEDAEGDDDAEGDVDDMGEGDGSRSPDAGSRGSTPDVSKMTKRQRSRLDQVMGSDFLQLPMGVYNLPLDRYRECTTMADKRRRTANQEDSDGRRARHAPCGDGQATEESEREAQ